MTTTSRITTTATMTTSGSLKVGDLRALLAEAPDDASVTVREDRDRNMSSTTVSVTWEPQAKKNLHSGGQCR